MAVATIASIKGIVNGQTITLGEVVVSSAGIAGLQQSNIALSLPYPVRLDAGTAVTLVLANAAGNGPFASATVHYILDDYL